VSIKREVWVGKKIVYTAWSMGR